MLMWRGDNILYVLLQTFVSSSTNLNPSLNNSSCFKNNSHICLLFSTPVVSPSAPASQTQTFFKLPHWALSVRLCSWENAKQDSSAPSGLVFFSGLLRGLLFTVHLLCPQLTLCLTQVLSYLHLSSLSAGRIFMCCLHELDWMEQLPSQVW